MCIGDIMGILHLIYLGSVVLSILFGTWCFLSDIKDRGQFVLIDIFGYFCVILCSFIPVINILIILDSIVPILDKMSSVVIWQKTK